VANISRDTFNALKKYVSVRLQQGVPLVDADWNEMEDIRKYELRAFLKWFVGDGIPEGNDGFRIVPLHLAGTIILTAQTPATGPSSIVVDRKNYTAADALGFGADNASASTAGSSPARLIGTKSAPFTLADGMILIISANGQSAETVTFQGSAFGDISAATALEVATAINRTLIRVTAAASPDFEIAGGDGTPEGAGRCLVDGWDAINEQALSYTAQRLFNNDALAKQWGVDKLPPLTVPKAPSTDTIYLDVWEREVDAGEDSDLVNPAISIETCVRLKREWVVRVAEGTTSLPALPPGHAFYPLARLNRQANKAAIEAGDITDLRRTGLKIASHHDIRQITRDAYGESYTLDGDGQPNLAVSLREAINALLRGGLPATPEQQLTTVTAADFSPNALYASNGDIWLFWFSSRSGNYRIWYKQYNQATDTWGADTQLTTDTNDDIFPVAVEDSSRNIWVFWTSAGSGEVWCKCYKPTTGWQGDTNLSGGNADYNNRVKVAADRTGGVWVFWQYNIDIRYNHYTLEGGWQGNDVVPYSSGSSDVSPYAVAAASNGDIWLFWSRNTIPGSKNDICSVRYERSTGAWKEESTVTSTSYYPATELAALEDGSGTMWVFWRSYTYSGESDIWYRRYYQPLNIWSPDIALTADGLPDSVSTANAKGNLTVLRDGSDRIWVFWVSAVSVVSSITEGTAIILGNISYKTYTENGWGRTMQLTTDVFDTFPAAIADSQGKVHVFWNRLLGSSLEQSHLWTRVLTPQI
jgi:hypothetical protein